jgi:hypothetical protein
MAKCAGPENPAHFANQIMHDIPLKALAIMDEDGEATPAIGDSVTVEMTGTVTAINGENASVEFKTANGEALAVMPMEKPPINMNDMTDEGMETLVNETETAIY